MQKQPYNKLLCKFQSVVLRKDKAAAGNSTFTLSGVSCSDESFGFAKSLYLRRCVCVGKTAHRKFTKR